MLFPMHVTALSNYDIVAHDLTSGAPVVVKRFQSVIKEQLYGTKIIKQQTRSVAIFKKTLAKSAGIVYGNNSGRCAIAYTSGDPKQNFTFKCHRANEANDTIENVYPVNSVLCHPVRSNIIVTGGGDGQYCIWDKDDRKRLEKGSQWPAAITRMAFNTDGSILAYAVGNDWSKGHEYVCPIATSKLFLRKL